jgi:YcxB-like protein
MTAEAIIEQPIIKLDVHLEFREYLRANYWLLWRKLKILFIVCGIFLLMGISLIFTGEMREWIFLFCLLGFPLLLVLSTYLQSRGTFKSHLALRDVQHHSFTSVGVNQSAASSSGHTDWKNIRKVYENKRSFLLLISSAQMYLIPKSVFKGKEEVVNFRKMLRSMIGTRKRVLYLFAR